MSEATPHASFPPALDARLRAVLELIHAGTHADIGADHAHLPINLIYAGRVERCIAVELNESPRQHAQRNVARARYEERIDVRLGNGFDPVQAGEVESASMTGMGAATMRGILERNPHKVPPALVLQPNDSARPLRLWAQENGFHIVAETLQRGHWTYEVLRLERRAGPDPAYAGLPAGAALRYGPQLLRSGGTLLRQAVWTDIVRLTPLAAPARTAAEELAQAKEALDWLERSSRGGRLH